MDYFAHGFWSYILFHKTEKPFYAVLFGLMPDTLSWFVYMIYIFANGDIMNGPPVLSEIPKWVFTLYGISHSLIVCSIVIGIIYIIMKKIPIYVYAWPIAIIIDILTHTKEYLPTPFLWPVSDWHFPGVSWGTWQFMTFNYSLIIICITYIFLKRKRLNKK